MKPRSSSDGSDLFRYAADTQALFSAIRDALGQLGRRSRGYDTIAINNARDILNKAYMTHRQKYTKRGEEPPHA